MPQKEMTKEVSAYAPRTTELWGEIRDLSGKHFVVIIQIMLLLQTTKCSQALVHTHTHAMTREGGIDSEAGGL